MNIHEYIHIHIYIYIALLIVDIIILISIYIFIYIYIYIYSVVAYTEIKRREDISVTDKPPQPAISPRRSDFVVKV